jgi:hypothetical protein
VPTVRLSRLLSSDVDFLKLDIEGAEHRVVREVALAGVLDRVRECVMEYHDLSHPGISMGTVDLIRAGGFETSLIEDQYETGMGLVRARRR